MTRTVRITLRPMNVSVDVPEGASLQDVLFSYGVEFPCGGRGRCKGCRVRVLEGSLPLSSEQEKMLTSDEIAAGWRLSCQARANTDLTLELAQWEAQILADTTRFTFVPRPGLGVAVDVGTTTIVAQLIDLERGDVLAVRTALNTQARHGADIMSRVSFAMEPGGGPALQSLVRSQIGRLIGELLSAAHAGASVTDVVLVGNTVMHHLFAGHSVEPLSSFPFEPVHTGEFTASATELGWTVPGDPAVRFLPCIGGFVGSDILAGVLATGLHTSDQLSGLIDLGTNGEMVFGTRNGLICASTAAGPAFEGARIMMGMRAATGAIAEVHSEEHRPVSRVLGNVPPRGICGSGLVDAAAVFLDLEIMGSNGRLSDGGKSYVLAEPVRISQTDIRELQLAKGAIAAGIQLLLAELNTGIDTISGCHLAGAFGNYINVGSAQRIGLLPFNTDVILPAGNTALRGAKMALSMPPSDLGALARSIRHVSLSDLPGFQDVYVDHMLFPGASPVGTAQ